MTPFEATSIIEGLDGVAHSHEEVVEAFQYLIDTGIVWQLQGVYGCTATQLIDDGACSPATRDSDATHFAPEAF